MHDEEIVKKLERDLERLLDGVPTLQRALMLAKAFGEVYGERWSIEAKDDGGFIIRMEQPHA